MTHIALREFEFHGRTYRPGDALPRAVERWPLLRHSQRRGFIQSSEDSASVPHRPETIGAGSPSLSTPSDPSAPPVLTAKAAENDATPVGSEGAETTPPTRGKRRKG